MHILTVKSVQSENYVLFSQLCVTTLAMAKAGKILISGNNTVDRGLNGVQFNYAGAIDHKLALGDVDTGIDIEITGNNDIGNGLNAVQHNEFGSEDNGGSHRKHADTVSPDGNEKVDWDLVLRGTLGSGGVVGLISIIIAIVTNKDKLAACLCGKKKSNPAQNSLEEYDLR